MFRKIFGIPPRTGKAANAAPTAPAAVRQPEFIPVSKLTPAEQDALAEHGIVECDDGVCYSAWNTGADGELWMRQIASADGDAPTGMICGVPRPYAVTE